jgi:hypothetical protein
VDSMGARVRGWRHGQGQAGGQGRPGELHQGRRRQRCGVKEEGSDGATSREAAAV